ncbi:DUF305 domain-containing protein [Thermomonospora cellulosilytica]|uniref:Uncharacterized protein (DUF305 family) n=1 Tax=Thermomonospora cellulosilytica TaxID=1411118 RepID=A0A7W3N0J8_9ACTN|nr:DUF305 domain-containing protein [Thermomonospora cellulosilytica]MBA9005300.1 uncharacterized protein (DUF305 family) [Thermomonospora cellulosilytica]
MSRARGLGRILPALAFMVIGAGAVMLLPGGPAPTAVRVPAGDAVDIGFSQDMVAHHQQAVTMAQTVRGRVSPPVARLATAIELDQIKEIGHMQGWLALWNAPQTPSGPPMTWMNADHPGHRRTTGATMPGTASQQEIDRLGRVTGKDADVLFLRLMIRHHQGGLIMTTAAARNAAHPQVRALATHMTAEQHKEIAAMTGLLAALGHRPPPSPVQE